MPGETIPESARDKAWKGLVSKSALEKPDFKRAKLDTIRIDGGTQQRDLDPAVVDRYAELLKEGVKFPPAKLVYDGQDFWLWEGFHRYFAHQKAGIDEMPVYYSKGTQRDAVFLSFSANKDHGLPRPAGVAKKIIETILADKEWGDVPAPAIAAHVGVGLRYVEKVIEDARDKGKPVERKDTRKRRKSKTGGESNGDGHVEAVEDVPQFKLVTEDQLGNPLTEQAHIDVFTRAETFRELTRAVAAVKKTVMEGLGDNPKKVADELFAYVYRPGFVGDVDDLRVVFRNATPYALCPKHPVDDAVSRDACKWCQGRGWVGKFAYDEAVKDSAASEKVEAVAK